MADAGAEGAGEEAKPNQGFWEQARDAKANSDGWMSYFFTMATVMSITACGTCIMVIAILIPLIAFIVGVWKFDECPVNSMIPVYLIAIGIVGMISSSLGLWRQCNAGDMKTAKCVACLQIPLTIVWIIFFIAGTIWVYGSFSEVDTENKVVAGKGGAPVSNPDYCHPWVYWLAFFMVTVVYVLLVLLCCLLCAAACLMSRMKPGDEETPINSGNQDNQDQGYGADQKPEETK